MVNIKKRVVLIAVSLCLALSLTIAAGAQEYWSNSHIVTLVKLKSVSEFLPSHKTNNTAHGVVKGKYIRQASVQIVENGVKCYNKSGTYPKTYNTFVSVSTQQVNNPFIDQSWKHVWYYNN